MQGRALVLFHGSDEVRKLAGDDLGVLMCHNRETSELKEILLSAENLKK